MRPLQLTMQAFGSYGEKVTIDFTKTDQNLFLITGDTGSGKSTIFDAICFALYGEGSSGANAKTGLILQSQYVDHRVEPFVALRFMDGAEGSIYEVRRTPRHLRPAARRTKSGQNETTVSGSVELTMPDGTVYPAKETDRRIEEIVGLTKEQFTQIAMIAQGEFMALLRARSEDKKIIFRRLFGTGIYQSAAEELRRRVGEREQEAAAIREQCGQIVSPVVIPPDAENVEMLASGKESVRRGELSVLPAFIGELEKLCAELEERKTAADRQCREQSRARDLLRDSLAGARGLEQLYVRREKAQEELDRYAREDPLMQESARLLSRIRAAYEIRENYKRLRDAAERQTRERLLLEAFKEKLPEAELRVKEAEQAARQAAADSSRMLEEGSRKKERTERALRLFGELQAAEEALRGAKKEDGLLQEKMRSVQREAEALQEKDAQLSTLQDLLREVPARLAAVREKQKAAAELSGESERLEKLARSRDEADAACRKAREQYLLRRGARRELSDRYDRSFLSYLDSQAGLLADTLQDGQPCPVCGSLEHPSPFVRRGAPEEQMSAERLSDMKEELRALDELLLREAGQLQAAEGIVRERTAQVRSAEQALRARIAAVTELPEIPETGTDGAADAGPGDQTSSGGAAGGGPGDQTSGDGGRPEGSDDGAAARGHHGPAPLAVYISDYRRRLSKEESELRAQMERLCGAAEGRKQIADRLPALGGELERLREQAEDIRGKILGSQRQLGQLGEELSGFASAAEAAAQQKAAEEEIRAAEFCREKAQKALEDARREYHSAEAGIARCREALPQLEEDVLLRQQAYAQLLEEKGLEETAWQRLVNEHAAEETDRLQERLTEFEGKRTAARRALEETEQLIGGAPRPDLGRLQEEAGKAQQALDEAAEKLRRADRELQTDVQALDALRARLSSREKVLEQYAQLRTLYRLISGTESGARMDLETYAQRYYLEQILEAANHRFREMSGGQFELRMVDADRAGEGRNRGLDLMVYSSVTGKTNEVRSLSGGESFMAALSLALGMADRVQADSAAIHIDMMFIDEGFGSLSENARNQAVRVLQNMAGGSRLIGIISHVSELKQQIDDQLIVTRDQTGSHVRWQIR